MILFCLLFVAVVDSCCKLDGFSATELLSMLVRSEELRGAATCAPANSLVCGAIQKKSDCNVATPVDVIVWTAMQVDSMRDACLQRCEAAFGSVNTSSLPYTPMCCRFQTNVCSLFVSASLSTSTVDIGAACAAGNALDLSLNGCVDQADRACAQQFVDNSTAFDTAPLCFRDILRPPGCCSDAADAQAEFRVPAIDATLRVVAAPGFDSANGCFANASQVVVSAPAAALTNFDCAFKQSVALADSTVRGDDCARSVAQRFDATRLPPGTPMCISQYASGACSLHTAQRAIKGAAVSATAAFSVAQLDVTGDGCVSVADLRCRLAANELARRNSSTRVPTCALAARLALSQCLIAPPPFAFRDWRDRSSALFSSSRNKGACSADSVPVSEAWLTTQRPLFFCSGPTVAVWLNTDENTCVLRCQSSASTAWPLDAVLCCEWRAYAKECRARLGAGKAAADGNTVARDGVSGAQLALWATRGAPSGDCATLAAFALSGIALTYPRYVANATVGNVSYANEDAYSGGPFARAAAVDVLGEAAVASAEARCTAPLSPRCCRPNFGARGAPSQIGFELALEVAMPTNATCLPPTIYWQLDWSINYACAPDAVVLISATVNSPECMALCKQHQTEAPYLELCCTIKGNSDCVLAVGGRVPSNSAPTPYAFAGITTRYLDLNGDGCVNSDDLLCAVQATTTPSRVPVCSTTAYDRVIADCCRDEAMRSPAHVWAAFNGTTPATRCSTNGCVPFSSDNRLCKYAASPLAVWNATNAGACLPLCRAAQFGNGTLSASPQLCCQFTALDGLCTLTLGDVDSAPGGATPQAGDRATSCIAPSAQRTAYNESCSGLNSVPCLVTHAAWGVPPRPTCAPLPLPTACCAPAADNALQPGDIDGDGNVTPIDVAMVARGAFATLPAPLVAAGPPQCAASRNDTALVCGAVVANATCAGSMVDSINATLRGDATCRAWCESLRPPPTTPLARYCCLARAPGGALCTLIAATQLPVAALAASASSVSVCVQRALMAAAPEVPRVPSLLPSSWNPMAVPPSGASTPGCLGNADLACAVGRLAKRNDAYNCSAPPAAQMTLPPGVTTSESVTVVTSAMANSSAEVTTGGDNAIVTTMGASTDLIGPLVGVGVGALVLGILIGVMICFAINRRRQQPQQASEREAPSMSAAPSVAAPSNRRESLYATMPRNGTELAYIDLPAEKETKVEYTALP